MRISGTIIARNEEKNIRRAIESLRCCDEVLVVDSGSTDRTVPLAQAHGARVIAQGWLGYAAQKNFAAASAAHDWILSIDADEALSDLLLGEVWLLKTEGCSFPAYEMPRMAHYLGRWILHSGWYPDRKPRLYHRGKARWVGESIHESVQVDGPVGRLEGNLLHFTCDTYRQHLETMERYTTLAAHDLARRQRPIGAVQLIADPAFTFLKTYLLKQGFRDGPQGLTIAWMAALYNYLKYAKARDLQQDAHPTHRLGT